jgi:hypothetical protein
MPAVPFFPLLTEQVVDLMITQIQQNFNAQLTSTDNQYSDGLGVEPLDDKSIFISDQFQGVRMPSVHILFNEMAFQYSQEPNYLESRDRCLVVLSAEAMGADLCTRKVWRYGRVLFSVLNLASLSTSDGRLQINLIPQRLGYTQPIKDKLNEKARKFRMDCVLELQIKHYEKNII